MGVRIDAVPGKVYALKVPFKYYGVFNGQCSEVCGLRHAYMPIAVNFVAYSFFIKIVYMHFFASIDFFVSTYLNKNRNAPRILPAWRELESHQVFELEARDHLGLASLWATLHGEGLAKLTPGEPSYGKNSMVAPYPY